MKRGYSLFLPAALFVLGLMLVMFLSGNISLTDPRFTGLLSVEGISSYITNFLANPANWIVIGAFYLGAYVTGNSQLAALGPLFVMLITFLQPLDDLFNLLFAGLPVSPEYQGIKIFIVAGFKVLIAGITLSMIRWGGEA